MMNLSRSLLLLSALLLGACSSEQPQAVVPKQLTFPAEFLFGSAIAGFQVDMGCPTLAAASCEDPNSDWYQFVTSPQTLGDAATHLSGQPPSVGPGYWELYEQDHDRAANDMGQNALRFSIEWSRIFPTTTVGVQGYDALRLIANTEALDSYHAQLAALKSRGLSPVVTLNHYTLPSWIHDAIGCHLDLDNCSPRGWLDKDLTVTEIAKYAGFVAREFGGEIDRWATLNEPFAVLLPGYLMPNADRTNPPSVSLRFDEGKIVMLGLIEAHARMYDAIKAEDTQDADGDGKSSDVGIVYNMAPVAPADPSKPVDVKGAENVFYLFNMAYLNAVVKGDLDEDLDGVATHRTDLENRMDYLGINYYTRITVEGTEDPLFPQLSNLSTFNPLTIQAWEDYPRGLYEMVMFAQNEFAIPIFITENGVQITDEPMQTSFLVRHLTWLSRAIRDGADVRGYFYWSLIDNYEWNHGMDWQFGLYAIDKDDAQKTRTPREAASIYAGIIRAHAVSPELAAKYPAGE